MEVKEISIESISCREDWDLKLREDLMQVYKIADSIKEYGQLVPIICWKLENSENLQLLSGATILQALKRLGRQTVSAIIVKANNEEDALKQFESIVKEELNIKNIIFEKDNSKFS